MSDGENITICFKIMGDINSYPVKVNKNGSVIDLIAECSKVCSISPDDLNVRDTHKNFFRGAELSYYRVKEGDIIIGTKKFIYNPNQENKYDEDDDNDGNDENDDHQEYESDKSDDDEHDKEVK